MISKEHRLTFGKPVPDDPFIGGLATLYWRFATGEKNIAWSHLEQPVLKKLLALESKNSSVLEVGIGAGNVTALLLSLGFQESQLVAIEPNPVLLKKYQEIYPAVSGIPIRMDELDTVQLPRQDLVIAHMVLNHISDDNLLPSLEQTHNVLRDDGSFLFMVPDPLEKAIKHDVELETVGFFAKENAPWGGVVTYYHRSEDRTRQLLHDAGFESVQVLYRPMYVKPLNEEYPKRIISPYFLKDHDLHSVFPQRMVIRAKKRW